MSDTDKPSPVAEPASEDCVDTSLPTMRTALRAAWEGDYTKSARYVELTATKLEARDQHNQAKWLRIALEEMQGKRQPVVVYAMSVPAPAADERTPDSGHLAAAPEQRGELPEPAAWLVCSVNGDGSLMVEHSTAWEQAAHDHINDAINEHDIEDAATWVVRPAYTADQLRAAIAAERAENKRLRDACAAGWGEPALINTLRAELSTLRQQFAEAGRDGWTDAEADAARLALELECLLTDKDVPMPALSRWWDSAHEALELHRARFRTAIAAQVEAKPPGVERALFEGE